MAHKMIIRQGGLKVKLREYCECGGQLIGTVTPDHKAFEMQRIFWRIHSGQGHSAVEPSQCYSARWREEQKTERMQSLEA